MTPKDGQTFAATHEPVSESVPFSPAPSLLKALQDWLVSRLP